MGESGVVNDPNAWFADPRDLLAAIRRIVYMSVETARLPEPFDAEVPPMLGGFGGEGVPAATEAGRND